MLTADFGRRYILIAVTFAHARAGVAKRNDAGAPCSGYSWYSKPTDLALPPGFFGGFVGCFMALPLAAGASGLSRLNDGCLCVWHVVVLSLLFV